MGRELVWCLLLLLGLLVRPLGADEFGLQPKGEFDALPQGVVNTASPELGRDLLSGGDYGMGNTSAVEVVGPEARREVRIFRTPELPISHRRPAYFRVLLGEVTGLFAWIETPPVQGEWTLVIDRLDFDGAREEIFRKQMKPGIRQWVNVLPRTVIECRVTTKTTAVRLNRRFILTLSPVMYAVWPDFLPVPYRTIFD
jgi:hypothetical protein